LLLQRRRVGKSGHELRISCSSLEGVEEGWKLKRKGGLKEAEAHQSVPSASALVPPDVIAHLILLLEAEKL
jgi:hypothetical protein